jgi:hypothetical protein
MLELLIVLALFSFQDTVVGSVLHLFQILIKSNNEVIRVSFSKLMHHILFAETFDGFDTKVLEVSTVMLSLVM